ncbi:MAG: phosphate ABC transporter ATP-binding protein, partial [Candidatus Binatia bacterium]
MELQERLEGSTIKASKVEKPDQDSPEKKAEKGSILQLENVNFYYGSVCALRSINLEIPEKRATAFIGPSGCGKT